MASELQAAAVKAASRRATRVRHVVLGLTVAAYMITYMDRVAIASAAPSIQREFGFDRIAMGLILSSFRWGYALFQLPGGWLGDRIGPRRALTLIVSWWSLFTSATALCWNFASMAVCRFLFGVGESGAFPIATRSLSRWMLPSERGFAQGITHAGSRLGAALTPALVVMMISAWGWRAPFWAFGVLGLLWAAAWFGYYRDTPDEHPRTNSAERDLIRSNTGLGGKARARVPWARIFASSNLWFISAMYFLYGYCISIYLDWFPTYLKEHRGFSLTQMGMFASLPLLAGTFGDLLGGWASDHWIRAGAPIGKARRSVAMAGFLIAAAGIVPATLTHDPLVCVWFSCLGVFGLEVTVGVSWALPLDIGGDWAGSVSSVMNMCGNIGGAISPTLAAFLVQFHGWNAPFLVASVCCLAGAALYLKIDAGARMFSGD